MEEPPIATARGSALALRRGRRGRGHPERGHAWDAHAHHGNEVGGIHGRGRGRRSVHHASRARRRWGRGRGSAGRQGGLHPGRRGHH